MKIDNDWTIKTNHVQAEGIKLEDLEMVEE